MKIAVIMAIFSFSYLTHAQMRYTKPSLEDHKPCALSLPFHGESMISIDLLPKRDFLRPSNAPHTHNIKISRSNTTKHRPSGMRSSDTANRSSCPELHNLSGDDLVQALLEVHLTCLSSIFFPPRDQLINLFAEDKMISVFRKFAELAMAYQGDNQNNIINFTKYMWAAYFNYSNYSDILKEHFTGNVTQELQLALDEFVNNTYFGSTSSDNISLLKDFVQIILFSRQSVRYSDNLIYLLDHFSVNDPKGMDSVILSIFELYRLSHDSPTGRSGENAEFIDYILSGSTEPLEALIRFSKRENLSDDEKFSHLLSQAVKNIAIFLQYGDYPLIYNMALYRLEEILEQSSMEGQNRELRFLVSRAINYWSKNSESDLKPSCATYNVCSYASEWRKFLFRPEYRYTCQATDTIILHFMREIPMAVKEEVCADLVLVDNFFHETLNTQRIPISVAHQPTTDTVEGYIFASSNLYSTYGELFGITSNNAGLFRSRGRDLNPQFFAYEIGDENNLSILNFQHEFVHYLDARYNKSEVRTIAPLEMAVWWIEGIAEYIAHGTYYTPVFESARYRTYKLSEVFPDTPYDSIRTYYFGYLAINFFLKELPSVIEDLLRSMKDGWIGYVDRLKGIGTSLDSDFRTWLNNSLDNPAEGYCYSESESEDKTSYISHIALAGQTVNNYQLNSGYVLNKYNPIIVHSGSSYHFDITVEAPSQINDSDNARLVEAWVDWDDDKAFSDDEKQFSTQVTLEPSTEHTISQVLEVPTDARARTEAGDYIRMRLRISYTDDQTSPDVCSNYQSGETEDYVLKVFSRSSGTSYIRSFIQENRPLLRIHRPSQTMLLSDIFYVNDNRLLTYKVRSSDPETVSVDVEGDQLIIDKIASGVRTKPVSIFVTAIDTSDYQMVKEIIVVFEPHTIPVFLSASSDRKESILRIVNHSYQGGLVQITARDESGQVRGPVSLSLEALEAVHLNSEDLENGNEGKGLDGMLGAGAGNWHLTLNSDLDFHARSYAQTNDGFLTSMNEKADFMFNNESSEYTYFVPIFNPASNRNQKSLLTLSNHNTNRAITVEIIGTDDSGNLGEESVILTLPSGTARTLNAVELETGEGEGLSGAFGDGRGKWYLNIRSSHSLDVTNVIESSAGHLSNLSKKPKPAQQNQGVGSQSVLLFLPVEERRQGFVRIVNRSQNSGRVVIRAMDDSSRRYDSISLSFRSGETKYFNASDLENGNTAKGFPADGLGVPTGIWRLQFESELDIQVLNYMRHNNGFLTSLYGVLPMTNKNTYEAQFFNPASNQNQKSFLRFINNNRVDATVRIAGIDDSGQHGETSFDFTLPAGTVKTVSAVDLENGEDVWSGFFGDGRGKWRLTIESSHPVDVMNLIENSNGYLSNLSAP